MSRLGNYTYRLLSWMRRRRIDEELEEELRFCFEKEVEANLGLGLSREEARRAAHIKLGRPAQIKEACRDERGFPLLESFLADIRYGLRSLMRAPGFTVAAILLLALGIGANTAMFSVVKAVLLNPPPYPGADRIVRIQSKSKYGGIGLSLPDFEDVINQQTSFEAIAGHLGYTEVNLAGGKIPLRARACRFMPGFFEVMGTQPIIGLPIQAEDTQLIKENLVVLNYDIWQSFFGGDTAIGGRTVEIDDETHTVHGVMPEGFDFPGGKDVWLPWNVKKEEWSNRRDVHRVSVTARIATGGMIEQTQMELSLIWQRLTNKYPEMGDVTGLEVVPLLEETTEKCRAPLLVLMTAAILVLLVVSVNLAGLTLSRGIHRQRELSLRTALGAGHARLTRQLLTETLLLCLPGYGLGVLMAWGSNRLLANLYPSDSFIYLYLGGLPRLDVARLDPQVLGFGLAMTLTAFLISGLFPAFRSSKVDLKGHLRDGGPSATTFRGRAPGSETPWSLHRSPCRSYSSSPRHLLSRATAT